MAKVFIGVDPHKLSATIEVVDDQETVLAMGRFGTDNVVYRQLVDARDRIIAVEQAGPGGHSGATVSSSATDLTPDIGSSDKPQPGPAPSTVPSRATTRKTLGPGTAATSRRRAGGVNVERPTGRTTLTPTSVGAHSTASRTPTP